MGVVGTIYVDVNDDGITWVTIADVKAKIKIALEIEPEDQKLSLVYGGAELKDNERISLDSRGVKSDFTRDYTLQLTLKRRRRLTNQRLIDRFIRESIKCEQS